MFTILWKFQFYLDHIINTVYGNYFPELHSFISWKPDFRKSILNNTPECLCVTLLFLFMVFCKGCRYKRETGTLQQMKPTRMFVDLCFAW